MAWREQIIEFSGESFGDASGVQVKFRCDPVVIEPGCAMALDSADILALMSALYSDTDPKVEALQIKMWRQASPTRKVYGEMNHAE